jgi:hypothetical protein
MMTVTGGVKSFKGRHRLRRTLRRKLKPSKSAATLCANNPIPSAQNILIATCIRELANQKCPASAEFSTCV